MIREIHLHGALARDLGRSVFRFRVASPAEAVRALCLMVPGARERLEAGHYTVRRQGGKKRRDLDAGELRHGFGADETELHIIPRAAGAKRGGGILKVIVGVVLIVASFWIGPAGALGYGVITSSMVAGMGVSMALSGLSSILAPQPKLNGGYDAGKQDTSSLFSAAQNVATPGAPVPVVFGVCEVGSVVVSAAIHTEDRA